MIHHNFNAEDVTENTEFEEKKSMSKTSAHAGETETG
jgi:hypothetical protein